MLKYPVPRPYGTFVGRQWRTAFCLAVMGLLDGKTLKGEDAYILLRNGNVIRGNVEKSNGVAIIERGGNRRLKLDAIEVMGQGSSLRDLFVLRMRQRDRFDVSGLLEDARWGLRNGLLDEMEQPLKMVEMLDPTHPQLLLLRRQLEIAKRTPSVVADKTAPDKSAPERGAPRAEGTPAAPGNNVRLATAIERTPTASAGLGGPIAVDREEEAIDAELAQAGAPEGAVAHFSRHVQSLLISRCGNAGCHRSPTEAEWQLQHRGSHVRPPGRMTKTNLATTLRWIDRSRTGESELLKHAIRPHGGRDVAAIRNSDDPALDALKRWIESVVLWETQVSSGEAVPLTKLKPIPSDAVAVPIEGGEFLPKDLTDGLGGSFGAGAFAAGAFAVEPNAVRRASHMIEAAKEIEKLKLRHGSWSEASDRAAEGSLDPLTPIDDRPWGEFEPSDQGAVISGRVKRLPATKALSPGSGLGGGSEALPKRRNPGVGETSAESTPFTGEPITPFIPQRAMPNQALPQQAMPQQAMPQQARGLIVSPFSPD
jgi:hypothetical protein